MYKLHDPPKIYHAKDLNADKIVILHHNYFSFSKLSISVTNETNPKQLMSKLALHFLIQCSFLCFDLQQLYPKIQNRRRIRQQQIKFNPKKKKRDSKQKKVLMIQMSFQGCPSKNICYLKLAMSSGSLPKYACSFPVAANIRPRRKPALTQD